VRFSVAVWVIEVSAGSGSVRLVVASGGVTVPPPVGYHRSPAPRCLISLDLFSSACWAGNKNPSLLMLLRVQCTPITCVFINKYRRTISFLGSSINCFDTDFKTESTPDEVWGKLCDPEPSLESLYCNLSGGVALNVWFTTNGMCAKNNNIYVSRTSNNRVIMACELYCCLLPQCEALRTCRSVFPFATPALLRTKNVTPY